MATQQAPSVGRIVHYVTHPARGFRHEGVHRPAVIVHVWSPGHPNGCVQLQVFADGNGGEYNDGTPNVVWATSVTHDEETKAPGTWHWPEYVPAVES